MAVCANKNDENYKELVKARGTAMANYLWNKYGGIIPLNEFNSGVNDNISIFQRIEELNSEMQLEVPDNNVLGDKYKAKGGLLFDRVTEFVKEKFSKVVFNKSPEEYQTDNLFKLQNKGKLDKVIINSKEYTYDETLEHFKESNKQGVAYGNIVHKLIQYLVDKDPKVLEALNKLTAESGINIGRFNWINDNLELIFKISQVGDILNTKNKAIIKSEVPVYSQIIGVASQCDALIEHADGYVSLIDWKSGPAFFKEGDYIKLLKYAENTYTEINDSKEGRAKLELMLRALMLKENFPDIKFKNIHVHHLDKLDLWAPPLSVNVDDYLGVLENYFKAEQPEIYKKLNEKNLFSSKEYVGNSLPLTEEELSLPNDQKLKIAIDKLKTLVYKKEHYKEMGIKPGQGFGLDSINNQIVEQQKIILELSKMPGVELDSDDIDMAWFKRWAGNQYSTGNPILQTFFKIRNKLKSDADQEIIKLNNEFDKLTQAVKDEYLKNKGLDKIKDKIGLLNYNYQDLYNFMWNYNSSKDKMGWYGKTIAQAKEELLSGKMTQAQYNYLEFFRETQFKVLKDTMLEEAYIDKSGKKLTKLDVQFPGFVIQDDFMPRVPMEADEVAERQKGGKFSKAYLTYLFMKLKNAFIVNSIKGNAVNIGIQVKYLGNQHIIASEQHTLNTEIIFKQFTSNMIYKKYLDEAYFIGKGVLTDFDLNIRDKDNKQMKQTMAFLEDQIKLNVLDIKDKGTNNLTRRAIRIPGTDKYLNVSGMLGSVKQYTSMLTMMFNVVGGVANAGLITILNSKAALRGTLIKTIKGVDNEWVDFTIEDLTQAKLEIAKHIGNSMRNTLKDDKIHNLMKQLNYNPTNFDYGMDKQNLLTKKNKNLDTKYLYYFHSIPEEYGQIVLLVAQMKHQKFTNEQGKKVSMWDSYDNKGNWVGGKRGITESGQTLEGYTSEEVTRLKRVSSKIHGGYRQDERTALELFWLGQWVLQFKKFMPNLLENLFVGKYKDQSLGRYVQKDNYIGDTLYNEDGSPKLSAGMPYYEWQVMATQGRIRILAAGLYNIKNIKKYWNSLSDLEKIEAVDLIATVSTIMIVTMLGTLFFDDDDDESKIYARYHRLIEDISTGLYPVDVLRTIKDNGVSFQTLYKSSNAIFTTFSSVINDNRTKDGNYKGLRDLQKSIPVLRGYLNLKDISQDIENVSNN